MLESEYSTWKQPNSTSGIAGFLAHVLEQRYANLKWVLEQKQPGEMDKEVFKGSQNYTHDYIRNKN